MGCGASAAIQEPRAQLKLAPGQSAIIRNCPNARLNGERVTCEKYNVGLNEWLVKGDRFPLTVGMSLGEQFLEPQFSSDPLQLAPTLLKRDNSNVKRGDMQDLLRTKLEEKCKAMLDCSKEDIGEIVSDVHEHVNGIIQDGSGLGASGDCPFASADEVRLYYQFCLKVLTKWSDLKLGQDEQMDKEFFSQIKDLSEILTFLDTDVVPLPEETKKNIQMIQRDGLFPNLVRGQMPHGEVAVTLCLSIGQKWQLEETEAFQTALASLQPPLSRE